MSSPRATVCIPFNILPQGGMTTFMRNWKRWLLANGFAVTHDIRDDYDFLFLNSWKTPWFEIMRARKRLPGLKVIHRLDGSSLEYGRGLAGDVAQANANYLADVSIFQSQFARDSLLVRNAIAHLDGPVILNPVDLTEFKPSSKKVKRDRPRIAIVAYSKNRQKGTWRLQELAAECPNFDFLAIGRFPPFRGRENIVELGEVRGKDLVEALQSCDVLLQLSRNDACPNVVIEGLACGLPVVFLNSGGVPEIVGDAGKAVDENSVPEGLTDVIGNLDEFRDRAIQRAALFDSGKIFEQYSAVMQSTSSQPLPGWLAAIMRNSANQLKFLWSAFLGMVRYASASSRQRLWNRFILILDHRKQVK